MFQVCSCIGIRTLLLPVSVATVRGQREKAILQPEYEQLTQQQKAGETLKAHEGMTPGNMPLVVYWLHVGARPSPVSNQISLLGFVCCQQLKPKPTAVLHELMVTP